MRAPRLHCARVATIAVAISDVIIGKTRIKTRILWLAD